MAGPQRLRQDFGNGVAPDVFDAAHPVVQLGAHPVAVAVGHLVDVVAQFDPGMGETDALDGAAAEHGAVDQGEGFVSGAAHDELGGRFEAIPDGRRHYLTSWPSASNVRTRATSS